VWFFLTGAIYYKDSIEKATGCSRVFLAAWK